MWWSHENIQTPEAFLKSHQGGHLSQDVYNNNWKQFYDLHNILLEIGGSETCFPAYEEDMAAILDRGRYYPGRSKMMRGRPNKCHANTCELWENNRKQFQVAITTGYALSPDGIWRQHSWLVHRYRTKSQLRTRIVETTVKRTAYYGFEMTDREAEIFCAQNIW